MSSSDNNEKIVVTDVIGLGRAVQTLSSLILFIIVATVVTSPIWGFILLISSC